MTCYTLALPPPRVTDKTPRQQVEFLESERKNHEKSSLPTTTERLNIALALNGGEKDKGLEPLRPVTEKPSRQQKVCDSMKSAAEKNSACSGLCVEIGYKGGRCGSRKLCQCTH